MQSFWLHSFWSVFSQKSDFQSEQLLLAHKWTKLATNCPIPCFVASNRQYGLILAIPRQNLTRYLKDAVKNLWKILEIHLLVSIPLRVSTSFSMPKTVEATKSKLWMQNLYRLRAKISHVLILLLLAHTFPFLSISDCSASFDPLLSVKVLISCQCSLILWSLFWGQSAFQGFLMRKCATWLTPNFSAITLTKCCLWASHSTLCGHLRAMRHYLANWALHFIIVAASLRLLNHSKVCSQLSLAPCQSLNFFDLLSLLGTYVLCLFGGLFRV